MGYINSSHPNFIGGSKAVEIAMQQVKSSRGSTSVQKHKVVLLFHIYSLAKGLISNNLGLKRRAGSELIKV